MLWIFDYMKVRILLIRAKNIPNSVYKDLGAFAIVILAWIDPHLRAFIPQIKTFRRSLPANYEQASLPEFLLALTPDMVDIVHVDPDELRKLIDAMAHLDRKSPFGLCLRRSLLRFHFLRRTGLALGISFGVRFRQPSEGTGVAGHAWNTVQDQPYHENEEGYRGFKVIYRWPEN